MNKQEKEVYDRGYAQGVIQGRVDARAMKQNVGGCVGCAFEHKNEWEPPCSLCERIAKDYYRSKSN